MVVDDHTNPLAVKGPGYGGAYAPRRAGDPATLVADADKIKKRFNWRPRHDDLEFIVRTAVEWEQKLTDAAGIGNT